MNKKKPLQPLQLPHKECVLATVHNTISLSIGCADKIFTYVSHLAWMTHASHILLLLYLENCHVLH